MYPTKIIFHKAPPSHTLQGTNMTYLGKREIILRSAFLGDSSQEGNFSKKKHISNWSHFPELKSLFVSVFLPLHPRSLCDPFWFNLCCFSFSKQKHCHLPFGSTPFPWSVRSVDSVEPRCWKRGFLQGIAILLNGELLGMILELTKQVFITWGYVEISCKLVGWKMFAGPVMRSPSGRGHPQVSATKYGKACHPSCHVLMLLWPHHSVFVLINPKSIASHLKITIETPNQTSPLQFTNLSAQHPTIQDQQHLPSPSLSSGQILL